MPNDDISNNALIARMIQTTDIAQNILNALNIVDDKTNADYYDQSLKDAMINLLSACQTLTIKAQKDGYTIVKDAIPQLRDSLLLAQTYAKDIAYAGKRGLNMTAGMMSLKNKYLMQTSFADLNTNILFDIPASIAKNKAMEWYLSATTPANPTEQLIIEQYTRGHMTAQEASYYLGIRGVPANFAMWIYDSYEKYPSVRELAIASQFMQITDAQLLNYMKFSGITLSENKQFYLDYMHGVQLRTELNQYLAQLKADYNAGLMTQTELTTEITAHKPNEAEKTQIITNCNKQRTRTLLNMEVQTRTWFYRKGNYGIPATDGDAELEFYYALIEVDLDPLFANGIVRFEASKLGYPFEYEP
jgi:hypothetical protein